MNFPFNNNNGDAAMRRRSNNNLRNSLASVLGEVSTTDLLFPTTAAVAAPAPSTFVSAQNHLSSSSVAASLPALAQSLGLAAAPAPQEAAAPRTDILLEALNAAHFSPASLLDQVKASLIDQAIAKEKTRILNDLYLGLLLRKQVAAATPLQPAPAPVAAASSASLTSPTTTTTFQQQEQQPIMMMSARHVADSIGCQLRAGKPYIDVTTLPGLEETTGRMMAPRRNRGGVTESFPEKVHRMLKETSKDASSSIVSFLPHGRAFMVYDIDEFVATILPKYFKQSKWNSFARQLNLYGFLRLTSGPDAGAYYHELFLRGRPTLALHMRRVGVPQQHTDRRKHKSTTTQQPDFYAMKPLPSCEEEERTEKITSSSSTS